MIANRFNLGVIGCGNMGEAILKGILRTGFLKPGHITFYDKNPERKKYIQKEYKIFFSGHLNDLIKESKFLVVGVKPQDIPDLLNGIKSVFDYKNNVIISIAAGVNSGFYEKTLSGEPSVTRVMPNTPALVNSGISAISRGKFISDTDFEFTVSVIRSLGDYVIVPEELQNKITAISGSGPAYFFLFARYLIKAATEIGIDQQVAEKLVLRTITGASRMFEDVSSDTEFLVKMVASPGGTTEKAIESFKGAGLEKIVLEAVKSAEKRAGEIQKDLEKDIDSANNNR